MPPQSPAIQQGMNNDQYLEQQEKDLNERYLTAMLNLAISQQQLKINQSDSWTKTGKLINDFLTFGLVTLGVMAAVLAAQNPAIGSRPLFYFSFAIQSVVVIFSSIVRLFIDGHTTKTKDKIFQEFTNRLSKIDTYRIGMTSSDVAEKNRVREIMNSAFATEYEFHPDGSNWILKNGQKTIVALYVISFMTFILSVILRVDINH